MSFDLFDGLSQLGQRKLRWYDELPEDDKKGAHPFVLGRWMTGTTDQAQLVRLNTFFNRYCFSLGQEKGLLFKLLAAAATGRNRRYNWIKAPGAKASTKLKLEVIEQYYDVTTREAQLYADQVSGPDVIEMSEALGWEKDEINKLKKEVDGPGSAEKPGGGKKKKLR